VPYFELYCHLVWATKGRGAALLGERAILTERCIRSVCRDRGVIVHAVSIMPDHVHLAVSMPPRIAVSDLVKSVKGNTSHLLNHHPEGALVEPFAWQPEYGALSFGKRFLPAVVSYVSNQRSHHAGGELKSAFERTTE
jgi:putative transposase